MIESFGMQGFLCVEQSPCDRWLIKWEFDVFKRQMTRLIDERLASEDSACIGGHAGPAIGFNFVLAHVDDGDRGGLEKYGEKCLMFESLA
jgi:hypothetical protein